MVRMLRRWLLRRLGLPIEEDKTGAWWELDLIVALLIGAWLMGAIAISRI